MSPDFPLERLGVSRHEDVGRSDFQRITAEADEVTTCELLLWRSFTVKGEVSTPEGELLQGVQVLLLRENANGLWVVEGQWCVTGERGRYRFVGLAPTRRYAVGVRRASMWGDEDQEAGWKRVRERASSRPAEEWPTPGVWLGSQEIHPGPTLFQREVREPQEGDELRMDILLSVSDEGAETRR